MPDTVTSSVKSAQRLLDVLELLARRTRPVPTMGALVAYLLSEDAGYVTGAVVSIDGGRCV